MTPEQRNANKLRSTSKTKVIIKSVSIEDEWNKAVNYQYLKCGGFCAYCEEACSPFYHKLPQELIDTACEYNGNHPDCGDHKMKRVLKSSETLGNYEVWECQNDNCEWTESY